MKNRIVSRLVIAACCAGLLASCEKKEQAIVLPPKGDTRIGRVTMGNDYEYQVFYDFETNSVVQSSLNNSWDLSFAAGKDGYHLWMNGGKDVVSLNTHTTDFAALTALPKGTTADSWKVDDPGGYADSTAIGNWKNTDGTSKNEVYIIKLNDTAYRKIVILSADNDKYQLAWGQLSATTPQLITLTKDEAYNYIYFSFSGGIVKPEPPKDTWDIVFTRYKHIYKDMNNYPYLLNGVLLNPSKTAASADSTHAYAAIDAATAISMPADTRRDVIGFDWKTFDFTDQKYVITAKRNYVVHNRNGQVYKFHFLSFYGLSGDKGSPSFEQLRLQ